MRQLFLVHNILVLTSALLFDADLDQTWRDYKQQYGRQFDDPVENIQRRITWERMMHFIEQHNQEAARGLHSYTVGPNQFTDMTPEEFSAHVNGFNASLSYDMDVCQLYKIPDKVKLENLNASVDWRQLGYVTDVKDQGTCRGSFAFSAIGALEGQHFKATGHLAQLSEQNILDCSLQTGENGCHGGNNMEMAFDYVIQNNGVDTEKAYTHNKSSNDTCQFTTDGVGATMTSCRHIARGSEKDLQVAVALEGPVSVAIDASHKGFQSYKSGIYADTECTNSVSHGVLVVGYGTEGDKDYWIVKNSFGKRWGEGGYMKILRNKNMCGIAERPSFPVV